jgi:DNA-binding GntR family transcriptional regulator
MILEVTKILAVPGCDIVQHNVKDFRRPPSLTETVAKHIRESIVGGHFLPGSSLSEPEIGRSLGVSRVTVREALRMVRDEGLVEIRHHQGAFVTQLSERKARELYTFRALIEPYALRLALERGAYSPEDLTKLEASVDRLAALASEDGSNPYDIVAADIEFHEMICARSDHQILLAALRTVQWQTRLFILHTLLYRSDSVSTAAAHRRVLEAIRSGDAARAEESLRHHVLEAGASLLRVMQGQIASAALRPDG